MPHNRSSTIEGIAVFARDQCILRLGVAKQLSADTIFRDKTWRDRSRETHLSTVKINGSDYAVLVATSDEADVFIFSEVNSAAVLEFFSSINFAQDILHHLLTDPFDALTVVDANGRVVYLSPVHEEFFGLVRGEARGKHVQDVIENTRLDQVVRTGKAEIGFLQKMKGVERIVTRVPIKREDKILGAIGRVMFGGTQQVQELNRRIKSLESDLEFYRRETNALRVGSSHLEIIGNSPAIQKLRKQIDRVALVETPVFIRGESGTGKELIAHALHRSSLRREGPLVTVHAARVPAMFVEAEMFGYEPDAFAGADRKGRKGKFEQANGGSLLIDEIGDMPLDVQSKLTRVLQDRLIERSGSEELREVNFRLLVSSNRDLQSLIEAGQFRLDLYYRVTPIVINVPPLRDRLIDIPVLAEHFLKEFAYRHSKRPAALTDDAVAFLMEQAWPGNIRQLRNELEQAFVFTESEIICPEDLPRYEHKPTGEAVAESEPIVPASVCATKLRDAVDQVEAKRIEIAMKRFSGNKKKVALELGISRSYLYKKLSMMRERIS